MNHSERIAFRTEKNFIPYPMPRRSYRILKCILFCLSIWLLTYHAKGQCSYLHPLNSYKRDFPMIQYTSKGEASLIPCDTLPFRTKSNITRVCYIVINKDSHIKGDMQHAGKGIWKQDPEVNICTKNGWVRVVEKAS